MLIPFGVFSAAGAGGGAAAGSYELISTAYGTGSSSTITFSSIPSTYKHLQIRWTAVQTSSSGTLFMSFNGDTSTIKPFHRLLGNGSSVTSAGFVNQTSIHMEGIGSSSSGWFSSGIMDIIDYASVSTNKTARWMQSANDTLIYLKSALWQSTSAISTITITNSPATNFTTATRFSLYGIKG